MHDTCWNHQKTEGTLEDFQKWGNTQPISVSLSTSNRNWVNQGAQTVDRSPWDGRWVGWKQTERPPVAAQSHIILTWATTRVGSPHLSGVTWVRITRREMDKGGEYKNALVIQKPSGGCRGPLGLPRQSTLPVEGMIQTQITFIKNKIENTRQTYMKVYSMYYRSLMLIKLI